MVSPIQFLKSSADTCIVPLQVPFVACVLIEVMEVSIGSLKVTVIEAFGRMLVASFAGEKDRTSGGVMSPIVFTTASGSLSCRVIVEVICVADTPIAVLMTLVIALFPRGTSDPGMVRMFPSLSRPSFLPEDTYLENVSMTPSTLEVDTFDCPLVWLAITESPPRIAFWATAFLSFGLSKSISTSEISGKSSLAVEVDSVLENTFSVILEKREVLLIPNLEAISLLDLETRELRLVYLLQIL